MVNNINKLASMGVIKTKDLRGLKSVTNRYSLSITEEMINLIKRVKNIVQFLNNLFPH